VAVRELGVRLARRLTAPLDIGRFFLPFFPVEALRFLRERAGSRSRVDSGVAMPCDSASWRSAAALRAALGAPTQSRGTITS
jgi:hypothetical protein